MAVSLIVEDGTGKADANSYASLVMFRSYWEQKNIDYSDNTKPGQSDDDISAALIEATEYIDGEHYYGERRLPTQALSFPRSNLIRPGSSHTYPSYLSDDEIPAGIIAATCYLAGLIVHGESVDAPMKKVSSQSVSGVGSVTYADGTGQKYFPKITKLLSGLVNTSLRMKPQL